MAVRRPPGGPGRGDAAGDVHDDVMHGSPDRHGRPAVHTQFSAQHPQAGWRGDPERFGTGAAILVWDLALVYSRRMAAPTPLPARMVLDQMRVDMCAGQYQERGLSAARRPARVFGDPSVTGKPVGEDLADGKPTLLAALAWTAASPAGRRLLEADRNGADHGVDDLDRVRELIDSGGVRQAVGDLVDALVDAALRAIPALGFAEDAGAALASLAMFVGERER